MIETMRHRRQPEILAPIEVGTSTAIVRRNLKDLVNYDPHKIVTWPDQITRNLFS